MDGKYFAALDLGATSGRVMLDRGNGALEEIYRFPTPMIRKDGGVFWDFEELFFGIVTGLKLLAGQLDRPVVSISCDSWAQDFGMLDENGQLICTPFSYRDGKCKVSSAARLDYIAENFPEYLRRCVQILHIADLVHFFLCGKARSNYSLAAISGLSIDHKLFAPIADCEIIGEINHPALKELHGVPVISGAGHDTAAAFVCGEPGENEVVTSVGTWQMTAARWDENLSLPENFRLLPLPGRKYARTCGGMGLWPFQQCVKLWKERGDFPGYKILDEAAEKLVTEDSIDPDSPGLFSPDNMEEAIFSLLGREVSPAETTALLLRGTARKIAAAIKSFGQDFTACTAVGGGVGGMFFCRLLAKELDLPLKIGNTEASAAGNIAVQKQVIS